VLNYEYEILKQIESHEGEIDLETLMDYFLKNKPNDEIPKIRNTVGYKLLKMCDDNIIITVDFNPHTGLSKYFDTRRWAQEKEDEFSIPDSERKFRFNDEKGIEKLQTLRKIYDPTPQSPTNTAIFHQEFKGIFSQGDSNKISVENSNLGDSNSLQDSSFHDLEKNFEDNTLTINEHKIITNGRKKFSSIIINWVIKHIALFIFYVAVAVLAAYLVLKFKFYPH